MIVARDAPWWEADPIEAGDFYEDCRYHPVLCVAADYSPEGDDLQGISLVDGGIGSCSPRHCGPVKLTSEQAIERRVNWAHFEKVEIPRRSAEIDVAIESAEPGQVGSLRRRMSR